MMQIKTLAHRPPLISPQKPNFKHYYSQSPLHLLTLRTHSSIFPSSVHLSAPKYRRNRFMRNCINSNHDVVYNDQEIERENDSKIASVSSFQEGEETEVEVKREALENQTMWNQMREIVMFTGPATGLWLCGPLMSLIDTAVIGQGSSIELAALGPGTVVCDYMSYVFMFLSVATSNLVATSLARRDKNEVQHQISILLFVGLACGVLMFLFTRFFGSWALTAFTGPKNVHIVPAANTYVQIRGYAWPAVIVGWVAQSASLGMKDSWGPLKALAVSSIFNFVGDVVLCSFLGYGIAGAAWATMVSQVVAAYMMIEALNKKGYNAFAFSVPTLDEILTIVRLAAPVFVTMMSKVVFYSLLIYFATSMGTYSVAAHQVMLQTYSMCTVWGEPLSQTAQSFMPELIYGFNRSLEKARMLQKSLVIIGATLGLVLGVIGTSVPWLCPNLFTPDENVIREMHKVLLPYFMALAITPSTHSLEGTLMAGRDLKFLSLSMTGCLCVGALVLMVVGYPH
ncbi:protein DETOXIFICATION 46, chloroplastic isoform X2 [Manihot esculenta]|uniref:protein DETOXIFICATION 46, chloroplastic isoform X2 n=1 Tax=Manihot esculenta TaxID=3983 RepID=UPI000B5D22FD|nr:protein DETOXIFICATION 46, chloroplastic isoform X2 [Manihot esculenta]